ncbi:MAG: IS110 family transposase [Clostridiales bacterium]|nr:IS110 family transposase [Clostridiales bacterium]
MNIAVGIDVSKGKSVVAAMRPFGEVALPPREFLHTSADLSALTESLRLIDGNTRVILEATGRYHEPIVVVLRDAGIFVSIVNPKLIKDFGNNSLRKVKTDKADAVKTARYGLEYWEEMREHTETDTVRQQLKLFLRQYNLHMKTVVALQNNLILLLDSVFPEVNELFKSPVRDDGHHKWVDFVCTFYHRDCVSGVSVSAFSERYHKWCKRKGYNFSTAKAAELHAASREMVVTMPKNALTKALITSAAGQLIAATTALATLKSEFIRLAATLPEYEIVNSMYGVGDITGAQLMAEIGDVRRFANRGALIAFAGVDPGVNESGKHSAQSVRTTKRGSPHLRKTLFQIVSTHLKNSPEEEPVYQFIDRKRAEGKPYLVYMTAAANKFLRIYHAKVKEYLNGLDSVERNT